MIIPEGARNIEFLGHTDQGGRGDGVQVMVARGHAYVGTRVRRGVMVTDVRDPRNPRPVNFLSVLRPCLRSSTARPTGDLLLMDRGISSISIRGWLTTVEKLYYGGSISGRVDSTGFGKRGEDYSAGVLRVYDISNPANPRWRSGSWKCRASDCIASGGMAAAMSMARRSSMATPTTS